MHCLAVEILVLTLIGISITTSFKLVLQRSTVLHRCGSFVLHLSVNLYHILQIYMISHDIRSTYLQKLH